MNDRLAGRLKDRACGIGFDAVGLTSAAPLDLAERALREAVESGRLRDYGFARRPAGCFTRPDLALPGAKTIVAVAISYLAAEPEGRREGVLGRVARFARGRDYHVVLEERLRELGKWLSAEAGGASYRICADTGPMIDRAAAWRAGIGSYGKNTCIITRESGSWVVLGELVTDVELTPDQPKPIEECGDCSICLSACPSKAILRPFVIDRTRCISHLTQMRGFSPLDLRPLIGDRIYGCDTCQEVCPKNDGARPGAFPMDVGLGGQPDLIPLLNIGVHDFDRLIGPTAMGWIGRRNFRRNVAVALGNIGDPSAVRALGEALDDPEPVIRAHAGWALGQTGGPRARRALERVLEREGHDRVSKELRSALARL